MWRAQHDASDWNRLRPDIALKEREKVIKERVGIITECSICMSITNNIDLFH